uniref:Leucine zipper tumor suppressor 1 n=1 Tax=Panthera tigris altaica TaxID=74533 RepID=A0A8C9KDJ8_PANTA
MGSVSSLISGHSFHGKHCRASRYKLGKSSHLKKLNRYSDGLLRFGFSQDSGHGKATTRCPQASSMSGWCGRRRRRR